MTSLFGGSLVREDVAAHFEDVKLMRACLSVSDAGRAEAKAMAGKVPDLHEDQLWAEYVNDTIEQWVREPELRAAAPTGPEEAQRAYLAWLADRVTEPFRVSLRIVRQVCERYGADLGMHLAIIGWDQEIAWAHRLRRDSDPRTAVLASAALMEARRDPSRVFVGLAEEMRSLAGDFSFIAAEERRLQAEQIRLGAGSPAFGPLVLRWAERSIGPRLKDIPVDHLEPMAKRARGEEDVQIASLVQTRVLTAMADRPLRRFAGVMREAVQNDMTSDDLTLVEEKFTAAIKSGKIAIPPDVRLPYAQFVNFMRVVPVKAKENRATLADRRRAVREIMRAPSKWLAEKLPPELVDFGARSTDNFSAWATPITEGEAPAPADPIVDYGMFLIRLAMLEMDGVENSGR